MADAQQDGQPVDADDNSVGRRKLLAGGGIALAAAAAAKLAGPDAAEAGHNTDIAYDSQTVVHADVTNTTAGSTRISSNISGTAAFVALNDYPVGISRPDGMLGRTAYTTSNCAGVAGTCEAASGGIGVMGTAKALDGTGVYAFAGSVVPSTVAPAGTGIYANGPNRGVLGIGRDAGSVGVEAEAPATGTAITGVAGDLLPGETPPAGAGVFAKGPSLGVLGRAESGPGVKGESSTTGVEGTSTDGTGVRGNSSSATGVGGTSTDGTGVQGNSSSGNGVKGESAGGTGVDGRGAAGGVVGVASAATGNGVLGSCGAGVGARGETATGVGVLGAASAGGLAGRFVGRTVVEGGFEVVGGPSTTVIQASDGVARRLYSHESFQPFFEDFGEARLVKGRATVKLRRDFDALVSGRSYQIFLTEYGNLGGLYVARRNAHSFQVRSRKPGAKGKFGYRIVARNVAVPVTRGARVAKLAAVGELPQDLQP